MQKVKPCKTGIEKLTFDENSSIINDEKNGGVYDCCLSAKNYQSSKGIAYHSGTCFRVAGASLNSKAVDESSDK